MTIMQKDNKENLLKTTVQDVADRPVKRGAKIQMNLLKGLHPKACRKTKNVEKRVSKRDKKTNTSTSSVII